VKTLGACALLASLANGDALARPRDLVVPQPPSPETAAVSSNIIFLNQCTGN
jgi:hypothetical protein